MAVIRQQLKLHWRYFLEALQSLCVPSFQSDTNNLLLTLKTPEFKASINFELLTSYSYTCFPVDEPMPSLTVLARLHSHLNLVETTFV